MGQKREIWKYVLLEESRRSEMTLLVPEGAEILDLQIDEKNGLPHIWLIVDPEAEPQERRFVHMGTGEQFTLGSPRASGYVGTWQFEGLVLHTFEVEVTD